MSEITRILYKTLQEMLFENRISKVIEILSNLYLIVPPKIIVNKEEFEKRCLDKGIEGGYFEEPSTLIFHPKSAQFLSIVVHEFWHYIDFQLIAASAQDQTVLKQKSEILTRKRCELLGNILSS